MIFADAKSFFLQHLPVLPKTHPVSWRDKRKKKDIKKNQSVAGVRV